MCPLRESVTSSRWAADDGHALRPLIRARTWTESLHLLIDLPFGIAWFTIIVTGIALGVGLIPLVFIGVVVLLLTLQFVRVVSAIERARARPCSSRHRGPVHGDRRYKGLVGPRIKAVLGDAAAGRASATACSCSRRHHQLHGRGHDVGDRLGRCHRADLGDHEAMVGDNDLHGWVKVGITAASFVAGSVALVATPRVVHGLAAMDRGLIKGLLGADRNGRAAPARDAARRQPDASVDIAEAERTRIERDLHDGVQAQLVVAGDGPRPGASKASGSDPERFALIERAHDESKRAVADLRNLVRGIHPTVLTDRGLDAAVSALAARSPIPVTLGQPREATAGHGRVRRYFVIAEALTNAAKHSDAIHARVETATVDGRCGRDHRRRHRRRRYRARRWPAASRSRPPPSEAGFASPSPAGGPTTVLAEPAHAHRDRGRRR